MKHLIYWFWCVQYSFLSESEAEAEWKASNLHAKAQRAFYRRQAARIRLTEKA